MIRYSFKLHVHWIARGTSNHADSADSEEYCKGCTHVLNLFQCRSEVAPMRTTAAPGSPVIASAS